MSSIVQIKDSAYDGLQSLRVYGNTVQNLWVNPDIAVSGVTITANADGSFTLSGTSTGTPNLHSSISYALKPGSSYYLECSPLPPNFRVGISQYINGAFKSTKPMPSGGGVITIDSDVTEVTCVIYGINSGTTVSGTYRVMLNEGSEAQPWCPPGLSSVDKLSIVTAGKNLVDLEAPVNTSDYTVGNFPIVPGLKEGDTLTCTIWGELGKDRSSFALYNSSDSGQMATLVDNGDGTYSATFQWITFYHARGPLANTHLRVYQIPSSGTSSSRIDRIMLEFGSVAHEWEPYVASTTPIDLQGHTLNSLPDGTHDELHIDGGGNVVLEKRTETYIANGDEGWELSATSDVPYRMRVNNWSGNVKNELLPINEFQADRLPKYPSTSKSGSTFVVVNGRHQLYAARYGIQDVPAFSEWLESNPMTIIYPLAEPQTIDLGTVDLPKLRKKPLVNTICANGTADGTGFSLAPEIDCEYNRWSTYCDGFKTHGKHSYFDMGCCIAARDTGTPEKKNVTATVPYMSGFYDLSKLYGAIAFEARQLTYRFEFVEDSREELQQKKSQFLEWLSQVHDEEIADDDIPGRHFIGSLSEWEFEEGEEGQSGSLEVTFNCQPFLEADEDTTKTCNAGSNTVTVEGQAVNAYAKTASGTATIKIGGVTQSVGTTEIRLSVQLQPGDNAVTVTGSPVVLRWKELTV